jgi:hypothetical protein
LAFPSRQLFLARQAKSAHTKPTTHTNTTVAQRWFFTGEILFSISSIFGENQWIQAVSMAKFEKNSKKLPHL